MRRALPLVFLAIVSAVVVGCQRADEATPRVVDAGTAPVVVDAGAVVAVVVDAGSAEVPTVEILVDAGTMADPPADPPATGSTGPAPTLGLPIFNRLLVQPTNASEKPGAIQQRIEQALGAEVASMRKTAGTFWLVQLKPTKPPRTKLDQARAVERLRKSGTFKSVEGDQLMTIKTGATTKTLR